MCMFVSDSRDETIHYRIARSIQSLEGKREKSTFDSGIQENSRRQDSDGFANWWNIERIRKRGELESIEENVEKVLKNVEKLSLIVKEIRPL